MQTFTCKCDSSLWHEVFLQCRLSLYPHFYFYMWQFLSLTSKCENAFTRVWSQVKMPSVLCLHIDGEKMIDVWDSPLFYMEINLEDFETLSPNCSYHQSATRAYSRNFYNNQKQTKGFCPNEWTPYIEMTELQHASNIVQKSKYADYTRPTQEIQKYKSVHGLQRLAFTSM